MNDPKKIGGIVRAFLAAFAGYAAGKNWIPSDLPIEEVASALTLLITVGWSIKAKKSE